MLKFLCCFFWCACLYALEIELGSQLLDVEVAATAESRAKGLAGRDVLPEGTGMLFVYDRPQICHFWMKDTSIPLSIGFFDADQRLIEWKEMKVPPPGALQFAIYSSSRPAMYALEVPKGWFRRHQIKRGTVFKVVDSLE